MADINFDRALQTTKHQLGRVCGAATVGHVANVALRVVPPAPLLAVVTAPAVGALLVNVAVEVVRATRGPSTFERARANVFPRPTQPHGTSRIVDDVLNNASRLQSISALRLGQFWTGRCLADVAKNVAIHTVAMCLMGAALGCVGLGLPLSPVVLGVDMLVGSALLVVGHLTRLEFRPDPAHR